MGGILRWQHTDSRGLSVATTAAYARAKSGEWSDDEEGRADFRALVFGTLAMCAAVGARELKLTGDSPESQILVAEVDQATREDARDVQVVLATALRALAENGAQQSLGPLPDATKRTLVTEGGKPQASTAGADAGGIVIVAGVVIGVVIVAGIVAGVVDHLLSTDREIDHAQLVANTKAQELASNLAAANEAIASHVAREDKAGATIPYDEQELRLLDVLNQNIKDLSSFTPPPLTTTPNVRKVTESAASAVESVGQGAKAVGQGIGKAAESSGIGLGVALAAIGVIWALS